MSFVLQLIFAFLDFALSTFGLFTFLCGLVLFLCLPVVPMLTGSFKKLAHFHLWLAFWSVKRAAIVVSEHNDLLFKRMEFDDLGVEQITFGNETKEFEDPATALHHFFGFPFALADEVHGVLFDPRHAAIGDREHRAEEKGEMHVRATPEEGEMYNVYGWIKGAFEMPKRTHELVDLSKVRQIVTGTERAEYPARIETMYKNSRKPYASGSSITKFAMPVLAFLAVFAGLWLMATQGSTGGGASGGSTVSYGSILFGILAGTKSLKEFDWKRGVKIAAVVAPLPLLFLLVALFAGPAMAIVAFFVLGAGFWFLPFITLLARASKTVSGALAKFYLMLGLKGYRQPVLEWTNSKYKLRELDELGEPRNVKLYNLAGSLVGFSYEPSEDSWGPEVLDSEVLENRSEAVADGGPPTNIPSGYTRFPDQQHAKYAGYVPNRVRRSQVYIDSHIALSRFANAAIGEKSLRKLLQAKEKFGEDGWGLSDKTVLYLTCGGGFMGGVLGVAVFFL